MITLYPKKKFRREHKHEDWPLFFLAGPLRGGDDWQSTCCDEIGKIIPDSYVAIPWPATEVQQHRYYIHAQRDTSTEFDRQLEWERYHLELASQFGCIIFWLPCESKVNPRKSGPYARDTYGELGEWRGRLRNDRNLRVVVGAESEFPGIDIIRRNFNQALMGTTFVIHNTLAETVAAACRAART